MPRVLRETMQFDENETSMASWTDYQVSSARRGILCGSRIIKRHDTDRVSVVVSEI